MTKIFPLLLWLFHVHLSKYSSTLAFPTAEQAIFDSSNPASLNKNVLKIREIGTGFDLTGSYGTVAVSYANGSRFDIAKIEGSDDYKSLMKKWSLESSQHPSPPYSSWDEYYEDLTRQTKRRILKDLGFPASPDVAIFSSMLNSLRHAAEAFLGQNVSEALAATPNLVASYREDIEDSFTYIGLRSLDNPNYLYRLFRETNAAAASYGIGMCHDYTDQASCREELHNMTSQSMLSVSYTKDALCVELVVISSAYWYLAYPSSPPSMDFSLGSNALHDNPDEAYYWASVRDTIYRGIMPGFKIGRRPRHAFVFGESSTDPKFRRVLKESLSGFLGTDLEILDDHQVFAPARGAADIALRGSYMLD